MIIGIFFLLAGHHQRHSHPGTYDYDYDGEPYVCRVCLEDTLVQIHKMGIEHGYDVDRILWLGRQREKPLDPAWEARP